MNKANVNPHVSSAVPGAPSTSFSIPENPLELFLQSLVVRDVSGRTIKAYSHDVQKFIDEFGRNVADVTSHDIEHHLMRLATSGAKLSTVQRALSSVREFFSFLVDQAKMSRNPAQEVKISPLPKEVLSSQAVVALFQHIIAHQQSQNRLIALRYRRDELILHFMLFFGVRQYQIPLLKLSAIERDGGVVSMRVTDRLVVKLPAALINKLREYLSLRNSPSDSIFLDPLDCKPVPVGVVHSLLKELNYRIGLHCSPQALYHTYLHLNTAVEEKTHILSKISPSDTPLSYPQSMIPSGALLHA